MRLPRRVARPLEGQIGKLVGGHSAEIGMRKRIGIPTARSVGGLDGGPLAEPNSDGFKNMHFRISTGFVKRTCAPSDCF
jgi:hypothetical protein